jgi:hypothetical protein
MKSYLAVWPNRTFSIVRARSAFDLFDCLDSEDSPFGCRIFPIGHSAQPVHIGSELNKKPRRLEIYNAGENFADVVEMRFVGTCEHPVLKTLGRRIKP